MQALPRFRGHSIGGDTLGIGGGQLPDVPCNAIILKADPGNDGVIWVNSDSDVGTSGIGWPLSAGESSPLIPIDNLNRLYVVADDADDVVYWWCMSQDTI